MRWRRLSVGVALGLDLLCTGAIEAEESSAPQGRKFAHAHCAGCHAIGLRGASPMRAAPTFRMLAERFPVDDLADVLIEGVERRHPAMPDFRLEPDDAADLTAYLKTLKP